MVRSIGCRLRLMKRRSEVGRRVDGKRVRTNPLARRTLRAIDVRVLCMTATDCRMSLFWYASANRKCAMSSAIGPTPGLRVTQNEEASARFRRLFARSCSASYLVEGLASAIGAKRAQDIDALTGDREAASWRRAPR